MDRQPKEPEQTLVNDLEIFLCEAADLADRVSFYTHISGLHTAGTGWENLRDEIKALMIRARRMPK